MRKWLSRRAILQSAPLAACGLWGCGDNIVGASPHGSSDAAPDAVAAPTHPADAVRSCMALHVTDQRAVIVASGAAHGQLALSLTNATGTLVQATTIAASARGLVRWPVTNLLPHTTYIVVIGGVRRATFVTAPLANTPAAVRFAWTADADPSDAFANNLPALLHSRAPQFTLTVGDFPYADNGDSRTADDYHARHREFREHQRLGPWMSRGSFVPMYDDHEIRNNWDSSIFQTEPARAQAAMQAWDEWYGIAAPPGDNVRYRRARWGKHLEVFVLDTRRFRSPASMPDGPDKTMLGVAQTTWLLDALTQSDATFKVIATSVPLGFGNGNDHWSGYATARTALFSELIARQLRGIVFVSGDHHWFASYRHGPGLREFQAGPFARGTHVPPPAVDGVIFRYVDYNAGFVRISEAGELTVQCVAHDGSVPYSETLRADDLAPS